MNAMFVEDGLRREFNYWVKEWDDKG